MFGVKFYHGLTRKYVIAFGTLFNDIIIDRVDSTGSTTQSLKVPLSYAPKDKMLARVEADAKLDKPTAIVLPRMAFEITGMQYASNRHKNALNQVVRKDTNANKMAYMYQSVPYDIYFNLYIMVKNTEDGTKIIETILPYFKPQWDMTLNLIPEMNIKLDVPVVMGQPSSEDKYDGAFTERRALIWTIPFIMHAEYFGPKKSKPIIKFSRQDYYFGSENSASEVVGFIKIQPGLTANGNPTSIAADSVDPNVIYADDDFGFVIDSSGLILNE